MVLPRPQFRLSTLFWLTLAVACWFGGIRVGRGQVVLVAIYAVLLIVLVRRLDFP